MSVAFLVLPCACKCCSVSDAVLYNTVREEMLFWCFTYITDEYERD